MAAKPKPSKKRKSSFSEARSGDAVASKPSPVAATKPATRWDLVILFVAIVIGGGIMAMVFKDMRMWGSAMSKVDQYQCKIIRTLPHDKLSFTQGLFVHQGKMYESTGKYGESTMRIVDLESGEANPRIFLGEKNFGEGACEHKGKIYQLTWKEGKCFVYDLNLKLIKTINYEGQGWGLCSDGENLIMTNSGSSLIYVDDEDFSVIKKVPVRLGNRPVSGLNEMEFVGSKIYANKLNEDALFEIDSKTGSVTALIDLNGMWPMRDRPEGGVMNGIAYDKSKDKIYITGKYCPTLFEVEFELKDRK
jgi:glutamine cyclotransferase